MSIYYCIAIFHVQNDTHVNNENQYHLHSQSSQGLFSVNTGNTQTYLFDIHKSYPILWGKPGTSEQIIVDSNSLAESTEEQAISVQRTASSIESLTSSVAANRENSTSANELAKAASEVARRGGHVVNKVVQTMDSIKDSSRQIVDIISVIDDIAFQTNIQALNATVEAARADEQGRGFAVMASEVRNLAQRSASAAKEIKALITDSTQRIELGNTLVSKTGLTMEEIVASVNQMSQMISAINQSIQHRTDNRSRTSPYRSQHHQQRQCRQQPGKRIDSTADASQFVDSDHGAVYYVGSTGGEAIK
ncbi:methyl-accepting chemotaxis protein [Undibacterium sp. Ji50W]|uniref:methyl-accepting chemotaxis protein n=1 Tax=Undibacterium sp. Ji50W TaxID=3413041 RepID=UPI003BF22531